MTDLVNRGVSCGKCEEVLLLRLCVLLSIHFACHLRFLEQRKEITEKFTAEQDALLREAQEKHASELQLLQERHQQHVLSLTAELEAKHQASVEELKAVFQREQWALSEAYVAELQMKHAAEIHALETRHLSQLDSVESCYLSEMQALRDEHGRALELLRGELEEQLQKKDSSHQMILTQELEKLQRKHDEELQSAKGSWRAERSTEHTESLRALAAELREAHQVRTGPFPCLRTGVFSGLCDSLHPCASMSVRLHESVRFCASPCLCISLLLLAVTLVSS